MERALRRMAGGRTTLGALAQELGMGQDRLRGLLGLMARLGYLEEVGGWVREGDRHCHGCARTGECPGGTAPGPRRSAAYALTPMGRRAAVKSMSREGHGDAGACPGPRREGADER